MFIIPVTVFLVLTLFIVVPIYNQNRLPSRKDLFITYESEDGFLIIFEINWDCLYTFSVQKIAKAIYKEINKSKECNFKIGNGLINHLTKGLEEVILCNIKGYRNQQIAEYGVTTTESNKEIILVANRISKNELSVYTDAMSKAIWLIEGESLEYRKVYRKTISELYERKQISKQTLQQLEASYYQ